MLTKKIWDNIIYGLFVEPIDYLMCVIGSLGTIPLDIILFPFEIIALVLYKKDRK